MNNKLVFYIGLIGVVVFASTCIIGGLLIENYSITSQYISETFAIDAEYGMQLRIFGHIPSGLLFALYGFFAYNFFASSKLIKMGFIGLGIFYGIGTIVVAIFPCDSGCNSEFINPSISQVIHNLMALLVYIFVPLSIIATGIGLRKFEQFKSLSSIALALGILSAAFVYILITNPNSEFKGLYQRVIESLILIWILVSAFKIRTSKFAKN
ncbi:DUF998 domain-containing protein [Aurantibacter sp.]|uniref:DUF998 domain-containing protein n=1 Tax=Aurantibacter sp. TaxID=2807103 RepID=UPI003265156D